MTNILKLTLLMASAVSLQIIQCKVAGKAAEIFNKMTNARNKGNC